MESKDNEVIVPITSLSIKTQEYVFLTNQIEYHNAQVAHLRSKRKCLQPEVCANLQQEQDRKRKFSIPKEKEHVFGNSYVGLCLYKRKRTKEFNSRTFLSAMVDACVPLFKNAFPSNVSDTNIARFAEMLANQVWDTRPVTTTFEITPMRRTLGRKKKVEEDDENVKKRKQQAPDANPAPTSMLKTQPKSNDDDDDEDLADNDF